MKSFHKLMAVAATAAAGLCAAALPAQAQPLSSAPYGRYPHEGEWSAGSICPGGSFNTVKEARNQVVGMDGLLHLLHLELQYYGNCGAIATIHDETSSRNTPPDCAVFIDRSDDGGATFVNEYEDMSSVGGYAESRIADNLNGRLARGAIVCGSTVFARTEWY